MATMLTGAFGFAGVNIAEALLDKEDDVVLVDVASPRPAMLESLSRRRGRFVVERVDVRDAARMEGIIRDHDVDAIVHAAAITADERRERESPSQLFEVNLDATVALVQMAAQRGIDRFLYVGSGSVYGEAAFRDLPLDEQATTPRPATLYAVSKYAAELAALRLGDLLGIEVLAVRLTELYGRWEFESGATDTLSPILQATRLAIAGRRAVLPRIAVKDRGYASDVARHLVSLLATPGIEGKVFNIGPGEAWPLTRWCELLAERFPAFSWSFAGTDDVPNVDCYGERDRASLSIDRLIDVMGTAPNFDVARTFEDYMAWLDSDPRLIELSLLPARRL